MTYFERFLQLLIAFGLLILSLIPTIILSMLTLIGIQPNLVGTVSIALLQLAIIGFFLWFGKQQGFLTWERRLWTGRLLLLILLGTGAMIILSFLGSYLMSLEGVENSINQEAAEQMVRLMPKVLTFLAVVINAPLTEETVFRGNLIKAFSGRFNWLGYVLSTVLFAGMHTPTNLGSWLTYAGMGAVLAVIRYRSKGLEEGVLVHGCNNLLAFIIMLMTG